MQDITPFQRWMIVIGVMTSAIMVLLDMTIANVALPQMQAPSAPLQIPSLGY
ncbi:multidrug resistance protein B [Vibrio ishigakensis]|uniref:Multidrug resistance protein B n=1 Tax=Vibrio ishigakensis TaxID=1481914 RepID=A0A0B8P3W0_9VIBR|nr:multidrug resistance protein B [Vibrio ishigakensis]